MARFTKLDPEGYYDIIDGSNGYYRTQGISGGDAMSHDDWEPGDEAWPASLPKTWEDYRYSPSDEDEDQGRGEPEDIAE